MCAAGRAVFLWYPDRFLVGTDTWMTWRWGAVVEEVRGVHRWLQQLPRSVAEPIAYGNAERLFGSP